MSPKRKVAAAKLDATDVQPQRKSTRTSKPTAKKAIATETGPPAAAATAAKKPTFRGKKVVAEDEIETDEESEQSLTNAMSKKRATKSVTSTVTNKRKPAPRSKYTLVEDDGDATDSDSNELITTPPSKRATKPVTASPATTAMKQKQTILRSKRTAVAVDDGGDSESDKFSATPPPPKKKKSVLEEATTKASAPAPVSRSTSLNPEPAIIIPPAVGAQATETVVSHSTQMSVAAVDSPHEDEEDEASISLAVDEETGEDEETGDEEEIFDAWTATNKDTATPARPLMSKASALGPSIDIPDVDDVFPRTEEDTPDSEAARPEAEPVINAYSLASIGMPFETSASSTAPGAASTITTTRASDTTSPPGSAELSRSVLNAQATLARITPSITSLMIAAMKHNRLSADVYPKVQRMTGQAFALKFGLDTIGQTLDCAVASVETLDRDFGRLADEARKSGLTDWE